MIHYDSGGWNLFRKVLQMKGSVFPRAFMLAVPCAVLTSLISALIRYTDLLDVLRPEEERILKETAAWGGFSFGVAFLIVFRTSQSYSRFWDGCTSTHQMRAEFFDGCSSLMAFCKFSKADEKLVKDFQNKLVRLFSMLHALALAAIEEAGNPESGQESIEDTAAFKFELLDIEGMDDVSLQYIMQSPAKVELIFQWIQQLIVENIGTGVLSIPPPILSRSFNEVANGMVCFHDAMKISYIPFPFPYAQTCDFLLLLHWMLVPFVISQWVKEVPWAFVFAFIQVFILWALNFIAMELENPFGMDANDIDGAHMQEEINEHLLLLMRPSTKRTPLLTDKATDLSMPENWSGDHINIMGEAKSFFDIWIAAAAEEPESANTMQVAKRFSVANPDQASRSSQSTDKRHSVTLAPMEALGNGQLSGIHSPPPESVLDSFADAPAGDGEAETRLMK